MGFDNDGWKDLKQQSQEMYPENSHIRLYFSYPQTKVYAKNEKQKIELD